MLSVTAFVLVSLMLGRGLTRSVGPIWPPKYSTGEPKYFGAKIAFGSYAMNTQHVISPYNVSASACQRTGQRDNSLNHTGTATKAEKIELSSSETVQLVF